MRAEPPRLAGGGGCALERERGLLLEHRHGRLEEDEHLGGGVEWERLEACGDGAEARDQRGAPSGDRRERIRVGLGICASSPSVDRAASAALPQSGGNELGSIAAGH
jgi:hypothetical protein